MRIRAHDPTHHALEHAAKGAACPLLYHRPRHWPVHLAYGNLVRQYGGTVQSVKDISYELASDVDGADALR